MEWCFVLPFACYVAVLGNHDYRGDVEAQLSPVLREIDSKWLCLRSFIVNAGKIAYHLKFSFLKTSNIFNHLNTIFAEIVEFFFVDTTPFVDKYFEEKDHAYDWSGILPRESYLSNLLKVKTQLILA